MGPFRATNIRVKQYGVFGSWQVPWAVGSVIFGEITEKKYIFSKKKREKNGKKTGENEGRQLSEHEER